MNTPKSFSTLPLLVLLITSLILSACQPAGAEPGDAFQSQTFNPMNVSSKDCSYGGEIKSVEALDETTVVFTLCQPDPAFAEKIAHPIFAIQDSETLNETDGDSSLLGVQPNGTGPYTLQEWIPGERISLVANPNYWGVPPKPRQVTFDWSDNSFERVTALRFSLVDVVDVVDPSNYYQITSNSNLEMAYRQPLNLFYLAFNNRVPPFDDANVRMGFGHAINRLEMMARYFSSAAEVADQVIPTSLDLGNSANLAWLEFNTRIAQDTLIAAGFDFDQEISFYYPESISGLNVNTRMIATAIQTQMDVIGVHITLHELSEAEFVSSRDSGLLGFYMDYLGADYPDPSAFFDRLFLQNSDRFGSDYSEIQIELNMANQSVDPNVRQSHYDAVNSLILSKVPIIPIAHMDSAMAYRVTVENVSVSELVENFPEMSTMSDMLPIIQSSEPASLWPADEDDANVFRVTRLLYDTLVTYEYGGLDVIANVADYWESNTDMTRWTFTIRPDIHFSNGAALDANDVVASFSAIWDASDANHKGRSGNFAVFQRLFGNLLNEE